MHDVTIRDVTADDVPAILNLYILAGIGDVNFSVEEAYAQMEIFRQYPSFRVYVATIEGAVAGTYELLIMDNLAKRGRRSGVVEDVAVDPQWQGQGIGRAMMEHAIEQCRQAGCYKLALSSNTKREDAHRFYEALGFERHGYSFRIDIEPR